MSVFDVPQERWAGFCEGFSRKYGGKVVSIEVLTGPRGRSTDNGEAPTAGRLVDNLALNEIIAKQERNAEFVIVVGGPKKRRELTIPNASRLQLDQPSPESNGMLCIESADGLRAVIRFSESLVPGVLDGVA